MKQRVQTKEMLPTIINQDIPALLNLPKEDTKQTESPKIPKIKYAHLRYYRADTEQEVGPIDPRGGCTVAWYTEPCVEGDSTLVVYACAYCHINDNYNRKIGRAKAAGRLKARNFEKYGKVFVVPNGTSTQKIYEQLVDECSEKMLAHA